MVLELRTCSGALPTVAAKVHLNGHKIRPPSIASSKTWSRATRAFKIIRSRTIVKVTRLSSWRTLINSSGLNLWKITRFQVNGKMTQLAESLDPAVWINTKWAVLGNNPWFMHWLTSHKIRKIEPSRMEVILAMFQVVARRCEVPARHRGENW